MSFKLEAISEVLIKFGGQTTLQSQRRNMTEQKSSLLTSHELKTTSISLQTTDEVTFTKTYKGK